ncbi:MAG: TauD/TfdA family dioxygenase [Actinomycetota bacterium]
MSSTLSVQRLDATFGAEVHGLDLRSVDRPTALVLRDMWVEHGLLVFPDQGLDRDEQDRLARHFGELEFEAAPITNVRADGSVRTSFDDDVVKSIRGNEGWHHDSTYMPVQARGAVVSAELVPTSGGSTGFADMRHAYAALDDEDRATLEAHTAAHSLYWSMQRAGYLPTPRDDGSYAMYGYHDLETPRRPLVKVHPDTGEANLNIGRHAHAVDGMVDDESLALLDRINAGAVADDRRVHFHEWNVGDVVIWDNRRLMHRATPFDLNEPRRIWHTRIAGDPSTEAALNHAA